MNILQAWWCSKFVHEPLLQCHMLQQPIMYNYVNYNCQSVTAMCRRRWQSIWGTFQRSLTSTTMFSGRPMSSHWAAMVLNSGERFNRTTTVLYPKRGPTQTCIQTSMIYLVISIHSHFLRLKTERICS